MSHLARSSCCRCCSCVVPASWAQADPAQVAKEPKFITPADGAFQLIDQPFQFGALELEGLCIFLDRKRGNCAACHVPPRFTDFGFHNTGASQDEYDTMHGAGSFAALSVPDLTTRNADPDRYLPATAAHPRALELFRAAAETDAPDVRTWGCGTSSGTPTSRTGASRET